MQTIVLGTPDTQRPCEDVVRGFDSDELQVLDSDGSLCGYFQPALPLDHELYAKFAELFQNDADEMLRCARARRPGITTAELLRRLNELAPAEESQCVSP